MIANLVQNTCEDLQSVTLQAFNTDIEIMVWSEKEKLPALERLAQIWFQCIERQFSRFRSDSELTHINNSKGKLTSISDLMLEVLLLAQKYQQMTQGIFNPFILKALKHSGYNTSFEKIGNKNINLAKSLPQSELSNSTLTLTLDPEARSLQLPQGIEMDLGGIVKSWAAKRLVQEYKHEFGIKRGFVNTGGDLCVWGSSAESGEPWLIGIEDPWRPSQDIGILALESGAVATSSILGRQWLTAQGPMHHLIDSRTMQPSTSNIVQCTVTGPDVIECEIWTKVICILGLNKGLELFAQKTSGYEALLFAQNKETFFYGNKSSLGKLWRDLKSPTLVFNHPEVKIWHNGYSVYPSGRFSAS